MYLVHDRLMKVAIGYFFWNSTYSSYASETRLMEPLVTDISARDCA